MIKLYTRESCIQCVATKSMLDKAELDYDVVDLDLNPERVVDLEVLGYKTLPAVVTDNDSWAGFRPDKLSKL